MNSFPFDSDITYDEQGNPSYDRAYDSAELRKYFHLLFTDGIFADPSTALQATTSEQEMSVVVLPGNCNVQGAIGTEDSNRTLVFEAAGTTYDRIDSVVARLNINHDYRKVDLYVIKGTEATTPVAPDLTRTGGIYELRLANVFIAKNTTTIAAERITDTRLVSEDCGVVTANPQAISTTSIFNQYQAALDAYMQYVEECIDGTTAGNLQNQITALLNNQADAFSTTKTYAVGDFCIYHNQLYKCLTAITTAGAWDSSKWSATTVGTEITSQNESLTEIGKLTRIGAISLNAPVNVNLAQYRKAYLCIEIDGYVYDFHPIPVDFLDITKRISASYFYGTSNYIAAALDLSKTKAVLVDYNVVGFSSANIALYGEK